MSTIKEEAKTILFSRWLSICYADTQKDGISVLNKEDGFWYVDQLKHFNKVVYPNYIKNGTVKEMEKFIENGRKQNL